MIAKPLTPREEYLFERRVGGLVTVKTPENPPRYMIYEGSIEGEGFYEQGKTADRISCWRTPFDKLQFDNNFKEHPGVVVILNSSHTKLVEFEPGNEWYHRYAIRLIETKLWRKS